MRLHTNTVRGPAILFAAGPHDDIMASKASDQHLISRAADQGMVLSATSRASSGERSDHVGSRHGPPTPNFVEPPQSFMWGSSQSRRALSIRLMVSVVMKMASPGKAAIHHEFSM